MRLREYIIRKVISTFITIIVVLILLFIIFNLLGNPISIIAGPHTSLAEKEQLSSAYNIPINPWNIKQMPFYFGNYMTNMLTGKWGVSLTIETGVPVINLVLQRAPWTILLVGSATVLSYVIGIMLGIFLVWKGSKNIDSGVTISALFFYSMPSFFLGLSLLYIFAFRLGIFPLGGYYNTTYGTSMNSEIAVIGVAYTVIDILHHMILPVLVLTALSTGGNMYLMKQTLTGAMKEKYFMTAKVKGLSEWKAIRKHAIPNAMVPIASTIMISIGGILGGAILTEEVFGIPGMGLLLIDAILTRDIFVEEGTFFMLSLLVIFFNMFSDIMYVMMDPRTRF